MEYSLNLSADYVELQYQRWKSDPSSVTRDWQAFFEGFELASAPDGSAGFCDRRELLLQSAVHDLIHRYRDLGHLLACLDPLTECHANFSMLEVSGFGLTGQDLDRAFNAPSTLFREQRPLRDIVTALRETYCGPVGVEYMHLQDPQERLWLQERMEPNRNRAALAEEDKRLILGKLLHARLFEQFLHSRYVGQKRFSVEGAETVVPLLDALFRTAAVQGCREVILGMAHRGRLNVQANVLGKLYETIFCEFEDHYDPVSLVGAGDVKYHKGYMGELDLPAGKKLRVFLPNNPSHLEAIDPVVEGVARARQDAMDDVDRKLVLPVLIHGDAAFMGEGIVPETLNLSQLEGYHTGGTIHIVINNQIGFTTLPEHARSTRYATDMAKMLMAPIFHVHGEDPEAAVHVVRLAYEYRTRFAKDAFVDLVCYRKYGHNEGDEPYFTQPEMYRRIQGRPPVSQIYADRLQNEGLIDEPGLKRLQADINECLERSHLAAREKTCTVPEERFFDALQIVGGEYSHDPGETGAGEEELKSLARRLNRFPEGFSAHPRLVKILNRRLESVEEGQGIDWAGAEALAFASLLAEGIPVRLSGQDTSRGTFSQRHSVLSDVNTGKRYTPLNSLSPDQALFQVYDSCLSENAVLGFEYGYALTSPQTLVLWEAQFGDFANNAQTVIDQFVASAEAKWRRQNGIVLLLPHGLEGQGPEHSSARIERFLQLCAEDNIQVCNPTTPAQYFHLLRRQMKRSFRKPLIVMTPKSLLRHPLAVSPLSEMASGYFREVLADPGPFEDAEKVFLCSGKVYYDLVERRESAHGGAALVRIEQFYPFPGERLRAVLERYGKAGAFFWVQEEPENMGGWEFMRSRLAALTGKEIGYIGRRASASPATGYLSSHKEEQAALLERAFPSKV